MLHSPAPACRLLLLAAAMVVLGTAAPVYAAADAGAPADSTAALGAGSARGTSEPLRRHVSPARHAGRALLLVPYAGFRLLSWPVEGLLELNARWNLAQRLGRFAVWSDAQSDVRVVYGYESRLGVALLGLQATSYDQIQRGSKFRLTAAYLNNSTNLAEFRFRTPEARFYYEVFGHIRRQKNRHFFGLGPSSSDEEFGANRRRVLGEASVYYQPRNGLHLSLTGYAREQRLSDASDETSVRIGFPQLYALARKTRYTGVETAVALDTRDQGFYSTSGSLLRVTGGYNESWDAGDENYYHYSVDIEQYFNLYRHTRAFGLFLYADGIEADNPGAVPYTEYDRLGGRTGGRGYARYRFADRTQLLLVTSYRYRITGFIMGRVFVDWGTVAPEWSEIRLSRVDPSVGFGLAIGQDDPRINFHIGHSREGFEFFVGNSSISDLTSRRLR